MEKTPANLIKAIHSFIDYSAEKRRLQQVIHSFHDVARSLDRALATKSVDAIAAEEKEFLIQEKKLHSQTDHFEQSFAQYRKQLQVIKALVNKSTRITVWNRQYLILRKGQDIDIQETRKTASN